MKKKLGLISAVLGLAACGGGTTEPPLPPESRTYIISTLEVADIDDGGTTWGFNLDDMIGDPANPARCTASAMDYTSRATGETGVDNQFAGMLKSTLDSLLNDSGGTNGALTSAIQEGSVLLLMTVSDINSYNNDSSVQVQFTLGALPAGAMLMTSGSGLAPGQTFTTMTSLATVTGSITSGRLSAQTASLPLALDISGMSVSLMLTNVEIGARIQSTGLSAGELGAALRVQDIVELGNMIMPGVVTYGLIQSVGGPDLAFGANPDPTAPAGSMVCTQISAGLGFTGVAATLN